MKTIELSIDENYCSHWNAYCGVREFLQNALDGRDAGFEMSVEYDEPSETLTIRNKGVKLADKVWYLGNSSKAGTSARGQFGEGLALASLVLSRAGKTIIINNDGALWIPHLDISAATGVRSLHVDMTQGVSDGHYTVKISKIPKADWESYKPAFLDLSGHTAINTKFGKVLMDPAHKGWIFVKGIFVEQKPELKYGYDLFQAEVDRDRKMVGEWTRGANVSKIWEEACKDNPGYLAGFIVPLLYLDALDLRCVEWSGMFSSSFEKEIAETFQKQYGNRAYPCSSDAEVKEAGHYGFAGVFVPQSYKALLARHLKSFTEHIQDANTNKTIASWDSLSEYERRVFVESVALINEAGLRCGFTPLVSRCYVADFPMEGINGMHHLGNIYVSRSILNNRAEVRRVLVHELGHDRGMDGQKEHELAQGCLHAAAQEILLERLAKIG